MKRMLSLCAAALCLTLALTPTALAADFEPAVPDAKVCYPTSIVRNDDGTELKKIYDLSPEDDPAGIPRSDFQQDGFQYTPTDLLKQELPENESRQHTEHVSIESAKKDMESVLALLPQEREFITDDGLMGTLTLKLDTVQVEPSGYGSSTKQLSVKRSYPNLAEQDTQYIPKSLEDGGRTLTLSDIQWQTDNTANMDGYAVADRYTAVATYTGSATSYDDTGVGTSANTVQWRVRAKDVNGAYSGYTSSAVKTVVHNVDPTISGSDTDLGTVTSPPSMAYTVNDQDTDDELTVVESLDGNEIRTIEDAVRNQTYTFALTEAQFAALSNGQHTMQVKVTDTLGNSATRTTTFTRSVTGIEYIVGPIETDAAAEKILVSLQYYAAAEDVTVSVSNNAFDENPTWELATIGLKHIFSNSTKTAATWGIGVKVQIDKSAGYDTISSRPVSGSYI